MENRFIKESHNELWIAGAVVGALSVGASIWFYLIGKGAAEAAIYRRKHAQDYLAAKLSHKKSLKQI